MKVAVLLNLVISVGKLLVCYFLMSVTSFMNIVRVCLLIPLLMAGMPLHSVAQEPNAQDSDIKTYNIYGKTMGNNYRVTWNADSTTPQEVFSLRKKIESRLEEINASMSTWRKDSEISQFNEHTTNDEVQISASLNHVLSKAISIGRVTDGALDITVAPLVELWGFGPTTNARQVPNSAQINEVLEYTGLDKIKLSGSKLSKNDPRTRLDLSSIAKGYGVDEIAALLEREDIHHFLVDIGGELVARGERLDGKPWQVGVDKPVVNGQGQVAMVSISDKAVATSGDYRNFFEQDSTRFSHILDPKTGRSVPRQVVSATVIADDCASADALATAAVVMGVKPALAMAEKQRIALMLIENYFGDVKFHHSKEFKTFLQ
ncbi:FAD:protein FMN transferase [Shewanella canadensis]|uniref:FAD:protein FMN transferase n=2 Tax=Shewanella canadensis TaxID=271096 RepID=A0A3S0KY63_9GAMM|nr:FAD:protein FMN transferase [Shewanella canadensis]